MIEITSDYTVYAHSLWNGAGSDAPPPGWQDPGFDDAAWSGAYAPALVGGDWGVPAGSEAIWSEAVPYGAGEESLFRKHFDLPADLIAATLSLSLDDTPKAVYLNGALLEVPFPSPYPYHSPTTVSIPIAALVAGGHNLLAIWSGNAGGPAMVSFNLSVQTPDDTLTTSGGGVANTGDYGGLLGSPTDPAVRLKHATGVVDWEHDGTLWRVRSGGKTVLQAPFPVMSTQPAALLGLDAHTGLPMWTGADAAPPPPPPPKVSHTYGQPDRSVQDTQAAPDPLPIPPNAHRACGAAEAMAKLACVIYDAIVQIINKSKSDILADFTQGLKSQISAELVSLLTEAEFAQWAIDAVQLALIILAQIVETIFNWSTSLPLIWPPNTLGHATSQQYLFIRCAAFQALWLRGGDYLSRSQSADGLGTKDYWRQYLAPQWSFFAGSTQSGIDQANPPWQLVWIDAIIDRVSDGGWAWAAAQGSEQPSTGCTGCAGYPA